MVDRFDLLSTLSCKARDENSELPALNYASGLAISFKIELSQMNLSLESSLTTIQIFPSIILEIL